MMENTLPTSLTGLLIFSAGCLAGSVTTYLTLKKRFDKRLEKETEEAREWLAQKTAAKTEQGLVNLDSELIAKTLNETHGLAEAFDNLKKVTDEIKETLATGDDELFIYQITPDEFGENGFAETQLFYYAADETLADAEDNEIDPDETNVGDELNTFIYTDAENVYVRNTKTKTDYEIVRVEGSFASMESEGLYD